MLPIPSHPPESGTPAHHPCPCSELLGVPLGLWARPARSELALGRGLGCFCHHSAATLQGTVLTAGGLTGEASFLLE